MTLEDGVWKQDGEQSSSSLAPAAVPAAGPAGQPKSGVAANWWTECLSMPFSTKVLSGSLNGQPFVLERADFAIAPGTATSRPYCPLTWQGKNGQSVTIWVTAPSQPDTTIVFKDLADFPAPSVDVLAPGMAKMRTYRSSDHWAMKLRLLAIKNKQMPAYLNLRLSDPAKSHLEGYFYATCR